MWERYKPDSLCGGWQKDTMRKSEALHKSHEDEKGTKRTNRRRHECWVFFPRKNAKHKPTREKRERRQYNMKNKTKKNARKSVILGTIIYLIMVCHFYLMNVPCYPTWVAVQPQLHMHYSPYCVPNPPMVTMFQVFKYLDVIAVEVSLTKKDWSHHMTLCLAEGSAHF